MQTFTSLSKSRQFLILSIAASLAFVHVSLAWTNDDTNLLFSSLIFWPAAFVLGKEVDPPRSPSSGWVYLGMGMLLTTLVRGVLVKGDFLYLYPFLVGIGLVMTLAGLSGFGKYWKPLTLLFVLGVPEILMFALINPAPLTARFADIILWYTGYDVVLDGIWLHLPGGSVEVNQACSGLRAMTRLLGMAVLALLCLPRRWPLGQVVMLPVISIVIAFLSNSIRVALLAILKATDRPAAFDSLHGGSTSQLFSIASIALLMGVVWLLIQYPSAKGEPNRNN